MEQESIKQLEQLVSSQESLRLIVGFMATIIVGLFVIVVWFVRATIKNFLSNFNQTTKNVIISIDGLTKVTQDLIEAGIVSSFESKHIKSQVEDFLY